MLLCKEMLIAFFMRKAMRSPNGNNVEWLLFNDDTHQSFHKTCSKYRKLIMVAMKCSSRTDQTIFSDILAFQVSQP